MRLSIQPSRLSMTAIRAMKPMSIAPTLRASLSPSLMPLVAASMTLPPESISGSDTSPAVAECWVSG